MPIRPPAEILGPLLMERDRRIYSIAQTVNLTFSAADGRVISYRSGADGTRAEAIHEN